MATLTSLADFTHYLGADEVIGLGVGRDGQTIAILGVPFGGGIRGWRLSKALIAKPGGIQELELAPVETGWRVFPQPVSEGHLLIVIGRALRGENALLMDGAGRLVRSYPVGDGVAHALVDDADRLWVAYSDEGISGGDELARAGVNCFDSDGQRIWSFGTDPTTRLEDCYALNVEGQEAWFYGCCDFDLVHVAALGTVGISRTDVQGAKAIVRDGDDVALVGTYTDPWAITTAKLGDGDLVARESTRLNVAPAVLQSTSVLVGRGAALYVLGGAHSWRADILG